MGGAAAQTVVEAAVPMEADPPAAAAAADAVLAEAAAAAGKALPGSLAALNALPPWAAPIPGAAASAAASRGLHPHAVPTAGSGSTSTRDMLRSVFNRIKLLHPVAARLETPNSVSDLLGALARHFGPAMALTTEQLVRGGVPVEGRAACSWLVARWAEAKAHALHTECAVVVLAPPPLARAAPCSAARQGCQRCACSALQLGTGAAGDAG